MLYFFQIFYICLKIWTQYSNLGLTGVLYSFVIIFFDLHLIVLLISPSVEFAFLIAVLHCSVNFILLSTMMPKSRSFIERTRLRPFMTVVVKSILPTQYDQAKTII